MNDNQDKEADIEFALKYLKTGGLGEVAGFADIAYRAGQSKVQMDTDMALALCFLASAALNKEE